jgi:mediator of replication checkpoint protein 1
LAQLPRHELSEFTLNSCLFDLLKNMVKEFSSSGSEGIFSNMEELTPRSKIRKMLAGCDSNSEAGSPGEPVANQNAPIPSLPGPFQDTDSDEDVLPVAPRGRLAARLLAEQSTGNVSESSDVYSRIRSQLMQDPQEAEKLVKQGEATSQETSKNFGKGLRQKKAIQSIKDNTLKSDKHFTSPVMKTTVTPSDVQSPSNPIASNTMSTMGEITVASDSESDLPTDPLKNNRFLALVAKKRQEREQREAEEAMKKAKKREYHEALEFSEAGSTDEDAEASRKLTQRSKSSKKRSKKSITEENQETQRMARNMQLAHKETTRRTFTTKDFLQKFNRKTADNIVTRSVSSEASTVLNSDNEVQEKQTPPTSPEKLNDDKQKDAPMLVPETSILKPDSDVSEDEVPAPPMIDKGKARAPELSFEELNPKAVVVFVDGKPEFPNALKPLPDPSKVIDLSRTFIPKNPVQLQSHGQDSDSDLEIVKNEITSKKTDIFDRVAGKKSSNTITTANLPIKNMIKASKAKPAITATEMNADLLRKARQQAKKADQEKIEALKEKGIIIQTTEEMQREQLDIEDMLEKERQKVEELAKKEREAARKEKLANGEELSDSSEDEDYKDQTEDEIDLSGSEEEDQADEDGSQSGLANLSNEADDADDEEGSVIGLTDLFDEAASEAQGQDENASDEETSFAQRRHRNRATVLDEDDEDDEDKTSKASFQNALVNPFGAQNGMDNNSMSLSQVFGATMANSQAPGLSQEDSLAQLGNMVTPDFSDHALKTIVKNSQEEEEGNIELSISQSQTQVESAHPAQDAIATQYSEMPDPTQDAGFQMTPAVPTRFVAPPSTIDTVILPVEDSPKQVKKLKRIVRGKVIKVLSDDEYPMDPRQRARNSADVSSSSAFDVLKKGHKNLEKHLTFDKNKSRAKEMVEEQAVESDDEYHGLGGASDDSDGEADAQTKQMIDDDTMDVDSNEIQAAHA